MTKIQDSKIRGFRQTFIDAWQLYRTNFWLVAKLFLVFLGAVIVPWAGIILVVDESVKTRPPLLGAAGILLAILLVIAIYWAIKVFASLSIWACLVGQKEKVPGLKELLVLGKAKMWPIFAVTIISGLLILLGYIFLLIPGLILMAILAVATPALIIDRQRIFQSFDRSWQLVKGYGWEMLYFVLGINLLLDVVNFLVALLDKITIIGDEIIDGLGMIGGLIVAFLIPLTMLMAVLRFLDLRQIKEEKIPPANSKVKPIIIALILIVLWIGLQAWTMTGPLFTK